jgi:hypothetical protein
MVDMSRVDSFKIYLDFERKLNELLFLSFIFLSKSRYILKENKEKNVFNTHKTFCTLL